MVASINDKFRKTFNSGNPEVTFVTSARSAGATDLSCDNLTGWPTNTSVDFVTYRLAADGETPVAGTQIDWKGIVSGNSITNLTRVAGAVDEGNATNDIVEAMPTGTWADDLVEGILEEHNQDGTHGDVTATTLSVSGAVSVGGNIDVTDGAAIRDGNNNELLVFQQTASAVNQLTITNAATGNAPSIGATGGDANVDVLASGKGTGSFRHAGVYDGWVAANETLTYASATTFTCSADLAGVLRSGDKIKLTQTTVKYFSVVSASGTTITVIGGSDYTLANADITLPYYSHEANPVGFPAMFNYAGNASGFSSLATAIYRFRLDGKVVSLTCSITGTSNSTGFAMTSPIASRTISGGLWQAAIAVGTNNSVNLTSTGRCYLQNASSSIVFGPASNSDTWTSSGTKGVNFTLTYEIN